MDLLNGTQNNNLLRICFFEVKILCMKCCLFNLLIKINIIASFLHNAISCM